jgi:hypothetical protein
MTRAYHRGSPTRQPLDSGQRSSDTEIVSDLSRIIWALHGHIEIRPDKNAFARNVTEILKYWDTRHMQKLLSYVQSKIDEAV